jgi:hypothetical protein
MKSITHLLPVILAALLVSAVLGACSPRTASPSPAGLDQNRQSAQQTLLDFLSALHSGQYETAASLYGGTYDVMHDHNPLLDPSDHAALLRNACTINGAACLEVLAIESAPDDEGTFVFKVQFQQEDGSLFVLDPCINSGSGSPSVSTFLFHVSPDLLVLDMPPYLP